jgi:hypothetical protein
MKIKIFLYSFIFLISSSSFSQIDLNKTAQSTMNFLLVSTSPKASALGDAYTSIGLGSEAMFYNPAGLAGMQTTFDMNINYTGWIADIKYLSGGLAWNLNEYGVIGFNLLTVDYGIINGTSISLDVANDLGYLDNGELSNVGAYSAGLSYARAISREFSVGGTVKLVGQNLGVSVLQSGSKENDAAKLAFDAGVKYLTGFHGFMFGMSIRNFATNVKREIYDEQLPLIFSLGAAINIMDVINPAHSNPLLLAVDFNHQNNYSERVNFGAQYKFLEMIFLRAGYQTNRDLASWSAGIGLNQTVMDYNLEVNYSYSSFEIFDSVSRLSLSISF